MSQEYCRAALRVCVAQMCQHLGWNSIHSTPLELLTDILERYLLQLAKTSHRYSEQFGRTDVRLEDVLIAFDQMGIPVNEIQDYVKHVESVPFAKEIVSFPVPCQNDLKFPNPDSKEVQQRKVFEFVPEYLPYMHPELNEEEEEKHQPVLAASPERLMEPQLAELSPGPSGIAGEKRPVPSPGETLPFKRPRLTTSQPLPEEATQSQYEMTSVMMTNSGILSSMIEGKGPDIKPPPQIKSNVIIVRQKRDSTSAPSTPGIKVQGEKKIIRMDINKDPSEGGKFVELDNPKDSGSICDAADPDYKPKKKKMRMKDFRKDKVPFKIKRGPGRPRSPASAVVHNKRAIDFRIPKIGDKPAVSPTPDVALDLSMKPVPPAPNISVVKIDDKKDSNSASPEVRQKSFTQLTEKEERDMDDTIAKVIGGFGSEAEKKRPEVIVKKHTGDHKEKKKKKVSEEWTVSHISESPGDDDDDDDVSDGEIKDEPTDTAAHAETPYPPPVLAPHLLILQQQQVRPRGRPRGSTSGLYKMLTQRSPIGRRPGRPPLRGKSPVRSPGRPPLANRSPGRPPLSRSPGMSRSPGRPPLSRSPGRPPLNRSPGRPKNTPGMSPKPRGRPRGSKSPRNRGMSPRGGSPRGSSSFLMSDDSREDTSSTRQYKDDDSRSHLFDFTSHSTLAKDPSPKRELSPPRSPSPENSPMDSSPASTEPALSRENTPDIESPIRRSPSPPSPVPQRKELKVSPKSRSVSPVPIKQEKFSPKPSPTPRESKHDIMERERERERQHSEKSKIKQEHFDWLEHRFEKERSRDRENRDSREREFRGHKERDRELKEKERKLKERERELKERDRELKERDRDYKEREKEHRDKQYIEKGQDFRDSREREHKEFREHKEHKIHRELKEYSRDRELKEHSKEREQKEGRDKEHREHKERSKDRDHKERSKDREHKERSKDREHKERSKDREHKERSKDREHKERSKDREHNEHSKEKDKSKEHRKDKKKKKKKNKDKEKEREEGEREKKEKHKSKEKIEKESRESSPAGPPQIQKLKIKFGGGSNSSQSSFSITKQPPAEPAPEPETQTLPKLTFKIMPPKMDTSMDTDSRLSWVTAFKDEFSGSQSPKPLFSSPKASPKHSPKPFSKSALDSDSDVSVDDDDTRSGREEEVTVSVVKGKIMTSKKPAKRGKRKGSIKKGKSKKSYGEDRLYGDKTDLKTVVKREMDKEGSPISPAFSPQNVPSPITIPALKAAPPPPSPPTALKKSPSKPKSFIKESRSQSPLLKDALKTSLNPSTSMPKPLKIPSKSPAGRKTSKKSPKVSPTSTKKKGSLSPTKVSPSKSFLFNEPPPPRTPSPRHSPSPAHSSPMYSPASSPNRDSPLHFMIPPTPAFPSRSHSPPMSPPSRQLSEEMETTSSRHLSTDEEVETPDKPKPLPFSSPLPPMPPSSAQKRSQKGIITETIGSFVNEVGEKIWICPACTMQDDGSPMIGCDKCDDWYHWPCVGIKAEPAEDESWYCPKCTKPSKSKGSKRGRKKKKI